MHALALAIDNLSPHESCHFLRGPNAVMTPDDCLLLGADRIKKPETPIAAYNDAAGITASFNLNLLELLNAKFAADFARGLFHHHAIYNHTEAQIEMYLESTCSHSLALETLDMALPTERGERVLTEIDGKFTRESLGAMLSGAGFAIVDHFEAPGGAFSLLLGCKVALA